MNMKIMFDLRNADTPIVIVEGAESKRVTARHSDGALSVTVVDYSGGMPQASGIVAADSEDPPVNLGSNPRSTPINVHECVFACLQGVMANNRFDITQDRNKICDEAINYAVTMVQKLDRL